MNGVEYLIGSANVDTHPLPIFHPAVCDFITELSTALLASPHAHAMPDLAALGFWGRKANLHKLRQDFGEVSNRLGRGLCLHIAPSNIPVNFAFSYLFALLAGNANVVRVPSKDFPQVKVLCSILAAVLEKYPEVAKRTAFVRYPRDESITATFSAHADVRMIWGGDATIAYLRKLPAAPRCIDITFADRYSIALLDGQAVLAATEAQIRHLAEGFYNDTFLMDQDACSSPQTIFWQHDAPAGRTRFWQAVAEVASSKYRLPPIVAVDKYTALCEEAIKNMRIVSTSCWENLIYRIQLADLRGDIAQYRGHGGYFHEYALRDWRELFSVVTKKFQTITCFGVDRTALRAALINACCQGIDRIVPVGQAMDIGVIWDGHDILCECSRIISLQ